MIFEQRDYQNRIHQKAIDYLAKPDKGIAKTVLIESPTGSGKTVMALRLAKYLEDIGHTIGFVAHRRELLHQAEASNKQFFKCKSLVPISLFTRNPEAHNDRSVVIVDECLPNDAILNVIHDGRQLQATIGEVVNKGIGTHVLSRNNKKIEYNLILNRTPMGLKEIYEVIIQSGKEQYVLPITANGRIYVDGAYQRVNTLVPNMEIEALASCWHKYVKHDQSKSRTISANSEIQSTKRPSMSMRLQEKSEMVYLHQKVQNVSFQPQSASTAKDDYLTTGRNYTRDDIGRRQYRLYQKPQDQKENGQSKAPDPPWATSVKLFVMAKKRIKFDNFSQNCSKRKQRFWKNNLLFFHSVSSKNLCNRRTGLSIDQNSNVKVFRNFDGPKSGSMVDGRWVGKRVIINSLIQHDRAKTDCRMVQSEIRDCSENFNGQKGKIALLENKPTTSEFVERDNSTSYDSIDGIQTGRIIEIRRTGRFTQTYDIGVDKVHNFYADGILVHNCQHDASKSASILHDAIRPSIIIGLTATPYRTDKAQLCFQKVIRDAGIHQLIREGFLAEFTQWVMEDEWTPANVARTYIEQPEEWGKSVIYFLTAAEARECNMLLQQAGILSDCILGTTPNRDVILKNFKKDRINVITNVAVLTEGFDEPSLKTAFVRPSSRGPTVQMAGRAFRKFPGLPVVNIVQNGETKFPFTRHASPCNQMIRGGDKWISISPKDLSPIFKKQRVKVAGAVIDIPEYLKTRMKKNRIMEIR